MNCEFQIEVFFPTNVIILSNKRANLVGICTPCCPDCKASSTDMGAGNMKFMDTLIFFFMFAGGARLPAFHTCVGSNDELLSAAWYKKHGMLLL
jgi:hypothetical protein